MNTLEIKSDWNIIKGKLAKDQLLGGIQKCTGEIRVSMEAFPSKYKTP